MNRLCSSCNLQRAETLFGSDEDPCAYCVAGHVREAKEAATNASFPDAHVPTPTKERTAAAPTGAAIASKELIQRALSRKHLLPFVERFNPGYLPGWVHKDVCRRLEKFSADVAAKKSPRLILQMPPRAGKQLADSTPILTENRGWISHGELAVGDKVYHPSGVPVEVLAVAAPLPQDVTVEFFDGAKIECHENHEWTVYDRGYGKWRTVETKWLLTQTVVSGSTKPRARFQAPPQESLVCDTTELPIDPYFLGAWLGAGRAAAADICGAEADLNKICARIPYTFGSRWVHKDTGVHYQRFLGVRTLLRKHNLLNNKHIPSAYLRAGIDQRRALLAGLVDTDGSQDKTGRFAVCSCSKPLIDQIDELVRGLGYRTCVSYEPPDTRDRKIKGGECWKVAWTPHDGKGGGYALPRKFAHRVRQRRRIGIKAVYRSTPTTGRCIQVDAPDGLYLAGRHLTATHNSTIASVAFPAWHLGNYPTHEIISCSYSTSLAMTFSRKVRNMLREESYGTVFPKTELDPESQSAEAWLTTLGGGYVSAGVGSGITGRGATILLMDDPLKNAEEAKSDVVKEAMREWYTSTAYTRLAPGGGVILIMTRWAEDDIAGWLLSEAEAGGEQWEVIKYPAIAEEDEAYRAKGEALHPERYDLPALERIRKAVGPRVWNALYQQNPTPDTGDYFTRGMFQFYNFAALDKSALRYYQAWDLAIGQNDRNDFTVGITVGIDRLDNMYIVGVERGKWTGMQIVEKILDTYEVWKPSVVGIERGHIELAIGPFLEKRQKERKLYEMFVQDLKTGRRDKEARARAIQGRLQQGKVLFPKDSEFGNTLMAEMLKFPNGEHDDQVDALAWIGLMMSDFSAPRIAANGKKSWKDKLDGLGAKKFTRSAMGA